MSTRNNDILPLLFVQEMLSKQADKQAFIFLKDVSFSDLRALVDYMYKGEVNVAQEQLASFLQTAEALDIKGTFLNLCAINSMEG